jgi:sugar lactone lactonase YvrE
MDSDGNIWISVMSKSMEAGKASIWKWDRQKNPIRIRENLSIPNSICIDKKLNRFYYTDTPLNKIFVGDLHSIESPSGMESVFFDGDIIPGLPDGSCLDSEGFMWNTRWDGGKIVKISPKGELVGNLELPFPKPTSVEINLRGDMYFTTATSSISENNGGAFIVRKIIPML